MVGQCSCLTSDRPGRIRVCASSAASDPGAIPTDSRSSSSGPQSNEGDTTRAGAEVVPPAAVVGVADVGRMAGRSAGRRAAASPALALLGDRQEADRPVGGREADPVVHPVVVRGEAALRVRTAEPATSRSTPATSSVGFASLALDHVTGASRGLNTNRSLTTVAASGRHGFASPASHHSPRSQ
jgi:hypothetical protein